MSARMLASVVGGVGTAVVATAAIKYLMKRARTTEQPDARTSGASDQGAATQGFSLMSAIQELDEFNELVRWMPAKASVRLARTSHGLHQRLSDPSIAAWCAESRRALLERRRRTGDLTLGDGTTGDHTLSAEGVRWTFERLHLCEHPPRFPRIYFGFASDDISMRSSKKLERVAELLARHPKLRLMVHGFAQPDAPGPIGEALAQARATAVREALLILLAQATPEFADEDPHCGVREDRELSPWFGVGPGLPRTPTTRLVGRKVQAIGRWRQQPQNRNFEELTHQSHESSADESEEGEEGQQEEGGGGEGHEGTVDDEEYESDDEYSRLRRAEFTLLGLDV